MIKNKRYYINKQHNKIDINLSIEYIKDNFGYHIPYNYNSNDGNILLFTDLIRVQYVTVYYRINLKKERKYKLKNLFS